MSSPDEPLKTLDPFHFVTDDTEESAKRAGLRQVQILRDDGDNCLRGSRMREHPFSLISSTGCSLPFSAVLRREDPEKFIEFERLTEKLLTGGLPSTKFWEIFVQCTKCNYVMPRQYFPYAHPCTVSIVEANLAFTGHRTVLRKRLAHWQQEYRSDDEESVSSKRDLTPELGSDDSLPVLF